MKKFKRAIAFLLVVCMLAGMSLTAMATEPTNIAKSEEESEQISATSADSEFMRILHLDNGRKYFTKNWIIALINEMEAAGYTHLELAFGNDGLRFLLDDMSVGTYTDAQVTAAIQAGNKSYHDFGDKNELTQSEMDEILEHAKNKGISIIPLLNNPGHMNAIVSAITTLTGKSAGYNGSSSTIDLENSAAVSFVNGLVNKYIAYFDSKECEYFNFGADEYANDVYSTGSMGFGALTYAGKYSLFVDYVNNMAAMVKAAGMKPVAFNDGIYFNQDTSYNFDTDIRVAFWTSGWSGYQSASASTMAGKGHEMINVNGDYYYVLGKNDQWDNNSYTYASGWENSTFMGSTVSNPVGGMFCIWCDYPSAETETQIAENTRMILRAMAAEMQGEDANAISTEVVSGGFNADGTIAETRKWITKNPENNADIAVSGYDLTSVEVAVLEGTDVPTIEGAKEVLAWNITPYVGAAKYTERGTITIPVPEDWINVRGGILASENGEAVTDIVGTLESGMFTFDVPHFSTVYAYEIDTTAVVPDETITLEVGSTHEIVIKNVDYDGTYATDPEGIASVVAEFEAGEGSSETPVSTVTAGESYYLKNDAGQYMKKDATFTGDITEAAKWTLVESTNGYMIHNENNKYLFYEDGWILFDDWGDDFKFSNGKLIDYYVATQSLIPVAGGGTINQSTITFTGIAPGTTYATVGDTVYKIVVTGKVNITIKYVDENGTVIKTETAQVADNATTYNISNFNHNNKYYVVSNKEINITPGTVTEYTVTVEEIEEDLSTVKPLEIEYWQTNAVVVATRGGNDNSKSINAQDAYSEAGVVLTDIIPMTGYKKDGSSSDPALGYWRSRLLPLPANEQTGDNGDDETLNGTGFTKVRYWNGSWAVYTDAGNWQDIDPNAYQLIAYYMNDMNLADEVKVSTSDWGKKGNGEYGGTYLGSNNVSLAFQIVYEDGTTAPADETATSLAPYTYFVDAWGNRGVGTVAINQIGDYQIWKVTAETGEHNVEHNGNYSPITLNSFAWDNNEMTVWEGEPVSQYTILNPANNPNTEGYYDNLRWNETNESILIRIYIKAEETEDSLNVVYYDEKFGDTLYEYNISVPSGDNFNDKIVNLSNGNIEDPKAFAGNTSRIDVTGYGIVNALGKTQNFQTDLTQVPEAVGKYNSGLYTYTGSVISEDGKTLYLYYNIDTEALSPMFVADYGRSFTFDLEQVVTKGIDTVVDVTVNEKTRYGTLAYDADTKQFTYTPTQVLPNIDVLTINIKFDGNTTYTTYTTTNAGVMPATTVDYEEGFATLTGFTGGSKGASMQNTWVAGTNPEGDVYGYDSNVVTESNKKALSASKGNTAEFTFTGTGVDLYVNSTGESGNIAVQVRNASNRLVKVLSVQTTSNSTITETFSGSEQKGLIAASVTGLAHGQYTVKVTTTNDANVYFDGFRVYGTLQDQGNTYYLHDLEDNPEFVELRDRVLAGANVKTDANNTIYAKDIAESTLAQVYATANSTAGAIVIADNNSGLFEKYDAQALLDNGPKNELFLLPGQSVAFKLTTAREVQVGLKAVKGTANVEGAYSGTISSERDMFYTIKNKSETEETKVFTITNAATSTSILSITKVKICDDPNFVFGELTEEDLVPVLESLGFKSEEPEVPVEPEVTYADATLNISLKDANGKVIATTSLKENGEVGKEATFTKAAIKKAVEKVLPANYKLKTTSFKDVKVVYGKEATANFSVAKLATATLKVVVKDTKGKVIATKKLTAKGEVGKSTTFTAAAIKKAAKDVLPNGYKMKTTSFSSKKVAYGKTATVNVKAAKLYTAKLKIVVKNTKGKVLDTVTLTEKGESGKKATYTKAEIKKAIKGMKLPKGYKVADSKIKAVKVNYGKTKTTTYKAKK